MNKEIGDKSEVLHKILEQLPSPIQVDPSKNHTEIVLMQLVSCPFSEDQVLDVLSKKIAVDKNVLAWYDPDWKKPKSPQALNPAYWSLFTALLIAKSWERKDVQEQFGTALKRINTAFQTLDITRGMVGIVHHSLLEDWAKEVLQLLVKS
jgi:hypothetical protein